MRRNEKVTDKATDLRYAIVDKELRKILQENNGCAVSPPFSPGTNGPSSYPYEGTSRKLTHFASGPYLRPIDTNSSPIDVREMPTIQFNHPLGFPEVYSVSIPASDSSSPEKLIPSHLVSMPQHGIVITGGNTAEDYYNPQFDRLPYLGHASIQRFTRRQKRAAKRARLRHEDAWMLFDMEIEDGSNELSDDGDELLKEYDRAIASGRKRACSNASDCEMEAGAPYTVHFDERKGEQPVEFTIRPRVTLERRCTGY